MLVCATNSRKSSLLFSHNSFSCHAVIHDNGGKLKLKRILAYQIIVNCHLECRSYNTPYRMNGTVTSPISLHFDKPAFCVRQFHLVDSLLTKHFFFYNVTKFIVGFCIVPHALFSVRNTFSPVPERSFLHHGELSHHQYLSISVFLSLLMKYHPFFPVVSYHVFSSFQLYTNCCFPVASMYLNAYRPS